LESLRGKYSVEPLIHPQNQGYGAALKTGYLWILQNAQPEDVAVSMDADNTHSPSYIPAMLAEINHGYDVVTASYLLPGAKAFGVPPLRRLMSRASNALFRIAFPIPGTRTYTNGFRAYRVAALQKAYAVHGEKLIEETGFPGGTELLLKVCARGARTTEIPFDLHYENRGTDSKINIPRTISQYLALLRRARGLARAR